MKLVLALLLSLPVLASAQWRPVKVSSGSDVRAIEENFRRASIYSNRKLDKFSNEAIYGNMSLSGTLSVGSVTTATSGYGIEFSTPVHFSGNGLYWDDVRTPLTATTVSATRPPVMKAIRGDLKIYAFENQSVLANEQEVYFTIQMPHGWDGSEVDPHLHYMVADSSTPTSDDTVVFELEYNCPGLTGSLAATNTVMAATQTVPSPYTLGYLDFADITPANELSSLCLFHLVRKSSTATDNFAHNVYAIEVDFHFRRNALGSRQEASR